MCGIIAYIGKRQAYPIVIDGLKKLSFQNYNKVELVLMNGQLHHYTQSGNIDQFVGNIKNKTKLGALGMGQLTTTLFSSKTAKCIHNATDPLENLVLVIDGSISNKALLKKHVTECGYQLKNGDDREIILTLIKNILSNYRLSLKDALQTILRTVEGNYSLILFDQNDPTQIYAVQKGKPLILGISSDGFYVCSEISPIIQYTQDFVFLNDNELAIVNNKGELTIQGVNNEIKIPKMSMVDHALRVIEQDQEESNFFKEIYDHVERIHYRLINRVNIDNREIIIKGLDDSGLKMTQAERFILTASGSSIHAAQVGEYLFEMLARIPTDVEYASEFNERNPIITDKDAMLSLMSLGNMAEVSISIERAKAKSAFTFGILDHESNPIAKLVDKLTYTGAVSKTDLISTTNFYLQVFELTMMALSIAKKRNSIFADQYNTLFDQLIDMPSMIDKVIKNSKQLKDIASSIANSKSAFIISQGCNHPIAKEAALKWKIITGIHTEGLLTDEVKHGPLTMINKDLPSIIIATNKSAYVKMARTMLELKSRKGKIIAIVFEGDNMIKQLADYTIEIPRVEEALTPLLTVLPLYLLAYEIKSLHKLNALKETNETQTKQSKVNR